MENKLIEKTISSKKVYEGVLLQVYRDEIELEDGNQSVREYIKHGGAVCIVPIDHNDNVYLVRQFRYPFGQAMLEIPAGKLEEGEDPLECAHRELEEEIGMTAQEMTYIGELYPIVAYTTEIIHMYVARGLTRTKQNLDADEFINVETMPLLKLEQEILQGNIRDGKTVAAVLKSLYM